ncbi:winged helix-turn-helix domain-containing protein [Bradyrhizobium ottawaense]|uniref:winged helix-turn-helix domain-containing protein n=1 Tax=Bradyrhizobium ottawaense TaxID=931866 RepID=UPI0035144EE1
MTDLTAGHGPRSGGAGPIPDLDAVSFGPFSLRSRLLEKDGVPVKLGSRAMDILRLLVSRAGEVVPKNEILGYAWSGLSVEEISLRVHVAELRKVLGDGKDGVRYITNIPSRGYCFVAPVQRGPRAEPPALTSRAGRKGDAVAVSAASPGPDGRAGRNRGRIGAALAPRSFHHAARARRHRQDHHCGRARA